MSRTIEEIEADIEVTRSQWRNAVELVGAAVSETEQRYLKERELSGKCKMLLGELAQAKKEAGR